MSKGEWLCMGFVFVLWLGSLVTLVYLVVTL